MVRHLIGRKHRQKYVELKRPDLVTWDKQNIITQGGKIIRARAQIIERQDGRGTPVLMAKRGIEGKSNISRVPPRQRQNRDRNISQTLAKQHVASNLPKLMDFQEEFSQRGRYPQEQQNVPPSHPEDPYMLNRARPMHQRKEFLSHDRLGDELQRADHRESDLRRREYMEPDYPRDYEEEFVEDPQRRATLEPGGTPRYHSMAEMPPGQAQHEKYYPEEAPPYRKPYPERDLLKEFYSEEVRRGQVRSAEPQPSQPLFPERNNQRWSLDRESGRHDSMDRAVGQGSSEPEAKRRSFPAHMSDSSRDHLFSVIRDYGHQMREPYQEEADANPGPSRPGPPNSQRQVEVSRPMPDIPEPFRRFLKRAADDEEHGKRKRKSRFSDATAEEMETTKEMFSDEYGPPNQMFGSHPRPVGTPLRPEIHRIQNSDIYSDSQSAHHTESYQRGGSESAAVFDMLKNVEIENAQEADFLKNKLCDLLKEFKAKKSEKNGQNSRGRAAVSKDYNNLKPDPELSTRYQYETTRREDLDLRRPEEPYFQEDHRERGWEQHEHIPDERQQEYRHPVQGEPRHTNSNRSRYEEVFGRPATHPDEPARYPERFQEPMHPRDYQHAAEEFSDSHSSAPSLLMEQAWMDRGPRPRYSNLDKITSTLLELVGRK
ncbi:uncharacterized protein LOC115579083 isoform X3 [Sparus aurata]|nr:uncharacterized protein LOC115579083 isoform X3 [Sparus aurata]